MPQPELLVFFRENTKDLPATTYEWFQLPNRIMEAAAGFNLDDLLRRAQAGEDILAILEITTARISTAARGFLEDFGQTVNGLNINAREEEAIPYTTDCLALASEQFEGIQLRLVRRGIFEGRATAQGHLLEIGALRFYPRGDKLKSFCALSLTADMMRADMETGYVTGRGAFIADGFGAAQMDVLQRKVIEKMMGQPQRLVLTRRLTPVGLFSIPADPEIRDIQRSILARLIPDFPSGQNS